MKGLTAKIYAKALSRALLAGKNISKKEVDKRLSVFLDLVKKQRHGRLLPKIETATTKILAKESGLNRIIIESARPLSGASSKMLKKSIGQETIWEQKINSELIAGIRLLKNDGEQIDFSLINKIKKVFAGI
ncbi:MAG: F0F1 ATP synthase subunit delta [Patescibacteria group bacterium]